MNTENVQAKTVINADDITAESSDSRLLIFDENNTVTTGKDINQKISSLDEDLRQLRAELGSINDSVEEGLDRLSDKDTDLTAKVSETYKRLGEIDKAYKALLEISSRIDNDIQKLNGDVSNVAHQSASGIKNLEQSTLSQSKEFAAKNQQVVSKVNHLVETSKMTSERMNQSIQSATEKMLQIEKHVINQIESLTNATKDKTRAIEKTVDHNSANILKLQSVDEAISRRASALEITAAELTVKGQYLDSSVEQLQISADLLSGSVKELKQRTTALEELTQHHGSLIDGLQKAGADIASKLTALSARESKHFMFATAGLILLFVAAAVIYLLQQNQFSINDTRLADNSEKITNLQQLQADSEAGTNNSLASLEKQIQQANSKIVTVQDQVQSVAGRLNQSLPFSQLGDDNIIHGPQWIADLPQNNLTVQLAYVDNKETLYKIAHRYRFQLKDSLSYFTVKQQDGDKYVLLSGSYPTRKQAQFALESLPGHIDRQAPVIRTIKVVQQYIAVE
ncbi:MAG: hypothetical protein LJE83_05540 [Gammaproteobacteria bacterium]|nr:hypothetical protein [Gammaproteobacteria bacterium]